ncbi:RNA processing factor [Lithospermum erythrorhizon]|uniref:RNA processing factor n=1 Tax=Lithospermum erythrorhizon TaxID=34254 RepID=A0AAV3QKA4_LITER
MKKKGGGGHQVVVGLFFRAVAAVMGCFFGCLRVKDSSASPSVTASSEVAVRKRNRLSSLMLTESMKEEELSKLGDKDSGNRGLVPKPQADADVNELKDEAKFLKAWGTLPETPSEIRKISREVKCQSSGSNDPEDSKFRPWHVVMPTEKLHIEKEPSQPLTAAQKCEELAKGTVSLRPDDDNNGDQSAMTSKVHADQGQKSASVAQGVKSVRFHCDTGTSSVLNLSPELACETSKDLGAASIFNVSKLDPYPTPLRLNDEMQTPGTVFSAYQDGMANGKKNRIRSQYVKAVLNPVENSYQWQGIKAEVSEHGKLSVELDESLEEAEVGKSLSEKEYNMESNVTNQDQGNQSMSQQNALCIQTLADRPIIGLVAAHWNEDEVSHISPKSWDGNGIPNSTSKYKEDQKVSWHSTPFVERLEKALSDDTIIPQRKPGSGRISPTEMSGLEESDTALSKLQAPVNKSIASC